MTVDDDQLDQAEYLDVRLRAMSVAGRIECDLGIDSLRIAFATYFDAHGNPTGGRKTLPFRVTVEDWTPAAGSTPTTVVRAYARFAGSLAALARADERPSFELSVSLLPPERCEHPFLEQPVNDAQHAFDIAPQAWVTFTRTAERPPQAPVRQEIAQVFTAPGALGTESRQEMRCVAKVLGARLARREHQYDSPGVGRWTLMRIIDPGEAYFALDVTGGWGELFPVTMDLASRLFGQHLATVIG